MPARRASSPFVLVELLGLLGLAAMALSGCGAASSRSTIPAIQVTKEPVNFAMRTFDPGGPPAEMPPLSPGELAVCDSNFTSSASLRSETRPIDATHAMLTITGVNVTLQANITIWTPTGASAHVVEHEQGHRQISEYYYKTADRLAQQIAETYVGRQVPIAGGDLNGEADATLRRLAGEFTDEYGKELNPDPAQEIYDTITDHSRNNSPVGDAVDTAIKDAEVSAPHAVVDGAK
jgi:hypothetical protein